MARITLRQLLDHAAEFDYGVPAFNINNMEQALAIMAAADRPSMPALVPMKVFSVRRPKPSPPCRQRHLKVGNMATRKTMT